jgi:hypothetical protein
MATVTDTPATEPGAAQPETATAIVQREAKNPVKYGSGGVQLSSLAELFRFAELAYQAKIAPKSLDSPQKIAVAIQFGAEFGLAPMASLRAVKVINGIPSFSGDAALALVTTSGKLVANPITEYIGEGDDYRCRVTLVRVGVPSPLVSEFSVRDAKLAGLWGKRGRDGDPTPWVTYPRRMLYYRALGFNLRDNFADVLAGAVIAEEADDYPVSALPAGAGRAPVVDTLMESIGIAAPVAAVMPAPPPSPADEPGAAEAAALFTDTNAHQCEHPKIPPSRVKRGKPVPCPDCGEELHGE